MTSREPILITGATGRVGGLIAGLLASQKVSVRALVRNAEKAQPLVDAGAEVIVGDLTKPDTVKPALAGIASVLVISSSAPEMVDLQSALAEMAKQAGVGFIVKISAFGANAKSDINLIRWHGQIEDKIAGTGVAYCFLRPYGLMQNLLGMGQLAKQGGTFKTCRTNGREAMVDARDIAEAAAAVLTGGKHEDQVYELSGPESLTVDEIAAAVSEIAGKRVAPERVSEDEYLAMMLGYGVPEWMTDDLIAFGRMMQETTTDVRRILGRDATPLKRFLEDHANVFRG